MSAPGVCKPKRSLTAYNIFFREQRRKILSSEIGGSGGFAGLARTIAARWKSISPTEHQNCVRLAAEDKLRYRKEMMEWSRMYSAVSPASDNNTSAMSKSNSRDFCVSETLPRESRGSLGDNVSKGTKRNNHQDSSFAAKKPSAKDLCPSDYPPDSYVRLLHLSRRHEPTEESISQSPSWLGNPRWPPDERSLVATKMNQIPSTSQTAAYSCTDDAAEAMQRSATRSAPRLHRGVFEETWMEPSESFDLDGDTERLYHRMLNSPSDNEDFHSYTMKFRNLR